MDLRYSSIMECKKILDGFYWATGLLALLLCSGVTGISFVNFRSSGLPIFHQHDRPLSTSPKSELSKRGDLAGTDEDPGTKMSIVDLTSDNILFANLSVDGNLYGYSVPDNGNGKPTIIRFHFADLRANVSALPSVSYSIITTSSNMDHTSGILLSARQMFPQISIGDAISLNLSLQNTATLRIPGNTSTLNANVGCQFSAHIGTLQANFDRISINASASDISVDAIEMQNGRSALADSEFLVISSSVSINHQQQCHLQLRAQTSKTLLNINLGQLDNLTARTSDNLEFLQFILTKSKFLIQSKMCQISFSNNTLNTTLRFNAGVLQRAQLGNIVLSTLGIAADENKPPTVSMTIQGRSVVKLSSQRKQTSSSETLVDNKLKGSIDSSNATIRIFMNPCRIQALFSNPTAIWTAEYGLRTTSKQFQLDLPYSLQSAFAINVDGVDVVISRLSSTDALETDHKDEVLAHGGVAEGSSAALTDHHEPLESAPLNSSEELSQIQITSIVDDSGSSKGSQDAGGNNAQGKFMLPLDDSSFTSGSDEGTSSVLVPTKARKTSTTTITTSTTTPVNQPDRSTMSHLRDESTTASSSTTSKTTTTTATTTTTTTSTTSSTTTSFATTSFTANILVLIEPTSTASSAEFTATTAVPTITTAIKELPTASSLITNDVSINGNPTLSMWRENANISADNTNLSGFLVVNATIAVLPDFIENLSNAAASGILPPGVFPSVTTTAITTTTTTTATTTTTTTTTSTTSTSTLHNILLLDKPLLDKYALELKIAGQSRPNNVSFLEKLRQNLAAAYNEAQTRSNLRGNHAHSKDRDFDKMKRSHDNHKAMPRRASKPRNLELKVAETEESKAGIYEEAQVKILNIAKQKGSQFADVLFVVNSGNQTIDAATAKQIFDGLSMDDLATLLDLPISSPVMTFEEVHRPSKSKTKAPKPTASNNPTSHVPSAVIALMTIAGLMLLLLCCLPISIAVFQRRTKNNETGFINNNLQSGFRIPQKSSGNNNLLPTFDELSLQRSDSSSLYATIEKPVVAAEARATVGRPLPPRPLEFEHSRSITEVKLHQPAKEQCMSEVEDASL